MRVLRVLAVLGSLLFALPGAQAASKGAQERAAKKACLAGDVAKGVDILTDLYLDTNNPTYIFNQGRCYEQNLRYEEALARFREYLVKAVNLSDQDKAGVEKHIAACQSYIGNRGTEASHPVAAAAEVPKVEPPAKQDPPATGREEEPVTSVSQQATRENGGSTLGIVGIVTAAIGGAALATGVVLNVKANRMASDLQGEGAYSRSKESQRTTYEILGWLGYGVGGACVAAGALLYYFGRDSGHAATSSMALVPAFAPDKVGAVLEGSF